MADSAMPHYHTWNRYGVEYCIVIGRGVYRADRICRVTRPTDA